MSVKLYCVLFGRIYRCAKTLTFLKENYKIHFKSVKIRLKPGLSNNQALHYYITLRPNILKTEINLNEYYIPRKEASWHPFSSFGGITVNPTYNNYIHIMMLINTFLFHRRTKRFFDCFLTVSRLLLDPFARLKFHQAPERASISSRRANSDWFP